MTTWDQMLAWGVEKDVNTDSELTVLITGTNNAPLYRVIGLSRDTDGNVFIIAREK